MGVGDPDGDDLVRRHHHPERVERVGRNLRGHDSEPREHQRTLRLLVDRRIHEVADPGHQEQPDIRVGDAVVAQELGGQRGEVDVVDPLAVRLDAVDDAIDERRLLCRLRPNTSHHGTRGRMRRTVPLRDLVVTPVRRLCHLETNDCAHTPLLFSARFSCGAMRLQGYHNLVGYQLLHHDDARDNNEE